MSIRLLDYQEEAIDNIYGNADKKIAGLYNEGKRSAAVVLPTGGGKSFVAMRSIEEMMRRFPTEKTGKNPNAVSEFGMHYFAPNTGILYQFRLHMAEHMIFNHYFDKYKSNNTINENNIKNTVNYILDEMFPNKIIRLGYDDVYNKVIEENSLLPQSDSEKIVEKIIKENLKNLLPGDLEKVVTQAYPNIKFECYQNLPNIDIKSINSKYFIFDEAHRGGAETWIKKLENLVKSKKDAYFLSITATPERNSDDKSLLSTIASYTGYNSDEIIHSLYFAKEYYLLNAIKDRRVISPKIVGFTCTLDESPEYINLTNKIREIDSKKPKNGSSLDKQKYAYITIKNKMDEIIGKRVNGKTIPEEEWILKKQLLIKETIKGDKEEIKFNPNGKFIAFIPDSTKTDLEIEDFKELNNSTNIDDIKLKESYLKSKRNVINNIKKLQNIFNSNIKSLVYHSIKSDKENNEALQQFGYLSSTSGGNKFIVTNKKLDEGVHIEDTDGEIMLDVIQINKKNDLSSRFLQQLGRCIRAIKPNEQLDKIKIPIVYDYANNFMRNFELLKLDGECILEYDQNATNSSEFFELAEIASKSPKNVSGRTNKNGEKFLCFDLGAKKGIIEFPNLERKKAIYKKTASQTYETLINVLEILEKNNIMNKLSIEYFTKDTIINDSFFKKCGINEYEINKIKAEFIKIGAITPHSKEYNLGEDLNRIKRVFYGVEADSAMKKVLSKKDLDIEKLAKLGIIYLSKSERLLPEYKDIVDINGFIKPSLKLLHNDIEIPDIDFLDRFVGINIISGTNYYLGRDQYGCFAPGTKDKFGHDIGGYDKYGYDKYGFNKEGIHKLTGQRYNEKQFFRIQNKDGSVEFVNRITGKTTDIFGYNIDGINPKTGFDNGDFNKEDSIVERFFIKHYWHKYNKETGKYSNLFTEYNLDNNPPVNEYGATKSMKPTDKVMGGPFCKDRKSCNGNDYYDKYTGLDIDGFNIDGFKKIIVTENERDIIKYYHRDTSTEYNLAGKDYNGNLEPNLQKGIEILTIIFENNDKINNKQYKDKFILELKKIYEKNGNSINDILDKALTMYKISPRLIYDKILEDKINIIKDGFNNKNNEMDKSIELIMQLSPKFHKQFINSAAHKRKMNKVFKYKMQNLFLEILNKYGDKIPPSISTQIDEYRNKYNDLDVNTFTTLDNSKKDEFRDFRE